MELKRLPRKPNVLAVDDKHANLLALEAVLEDDYKLVFASCAADAIALLKRDPTAIDLILMDVQMPEMDGFEAAAEIRKMEGCDTIPIIFVTAVYTDDPFVKQGYQAGGIDYFTKPFDPDILKMKLAVYASYKLSDELIRARERSVKESEELLRVSQKLSLLLEALPIGVLIADVEGRICQTTEEVVRILGAAVAAKDDAYGEILGWWDESGRMIKDANGPLSRAIQRGEASHRVPFTVQSVDGARKTVLISATPLRGLDARIVGAVVLIQDLTEPRKLIKEEFEQRITQLISLGVALEASIAGQSGA
jgi:CheY-like chemotaxis protein